MTTQRNNSKNKRDKDKNNPNNNNNDSTTRNSNNNNNGRDPQPMAIKSSVPKKKSPSLKKKMVLVMTKKRKRPNKGMTTALPPPPPPPWNSTTTTAATTVRTPPSFHQQQQLQQQQRRPPQLAIHPPKKNRLTKQQGKRHPQPQPSSSSPSSAKWKSLKIHAKRKGIDRTNSSSSDRMANHYCDPSFQTNNPPTMLLLQGKLKKKKKKNHDSDHSKKQQQQPAMTNDDHASDDAELLLPLVASKSFPVMFLHGGGGGGGCDNDKGKNGSGAIHRGNHILSKTKTTTTTTPNVPPWWTMTTMTTTTTPVGHPKAGHHDHRHSSEGNIDDENNGCWDWDQEILAFANYVQLHNDECELRQFVLQELTRMSTELEQQQTQQQQQQQSQHRHHRQHSHRHRSSPRNDSAFPNYSIQVFGSYATPAVCTFQSDIDVILWGAVEVVPTTATPAVTATTTAVAAKQTMTSTTTANTATTGTHAEKEKTRLRKQELLTRWKQALEDAAAAAAATKEEAEKGQQQQQRQEEPDGEPKQQRPSAFNNNSDSNPSPLFVLDWVGQEDEAAAATSQRTNDMHPMGRNNAADRSGDNMDNCDGEGAVPDDDDDDDTVSSASSTDTADRLARFATLDLEGIFGQDAFDTDGNSSTDDDDDDDEEEGEIDIEDAAYYDPDTSDDDDGSHHGNPVVSMHTPHTCSRGGMTNNPNGPKGRERQKVIDVLVALSRKLKKAKWTREVQVIKRARVPIIKAVTCWGFETDIGVGGHNGSDTSQYAALQAARYRSFSAVVLVLKVLLSQHDLNTPFTGGLGSYKLYVLVVHHIQQQLKNGGQDSPTEILASFFCRYGSVQSHQNGRYQRVASFSEAQGHQPRLTKESTVTDADGCVADLSNVFKIDDCVMLFRQSWVRLNHVFARAVSRSKPLHVDGRASSQDQPQKESVVAQLVDVSRLRRERQEHLQNAQRQATNQLRQLNDSNVNAQPPATNNNNNSNSYISFNGRQKQVRKQQSSQHRTKSSNSGVEMCSTGSRPQSQRKRRKTANSTATSQGGKPNGQFQPREKTAAELRAGYR